MMRTGERHSTPPDRPLLQRALALTRLGWRALPVKRIRRLDGTSGKIPCIKGYHGDHPFTEDEVRSHPWHEADFVGVALPCYLVALDVDVKPRNDGQPRDGYGQLLQMKAAVGGSLPTPPLQKTMTGGAHLLFRLQMPLHRPYGRLRWSDGTKLDIDIVHRRNRVLVVYDDAFLALPATSKDIPLIPEWLLAGIEKPDRTGNGDGSGASILYVLASSHVEEAIRRVADATDHRNDTLNEVAFALGIEGHLDDGVYERLRQAGERSGLDPSEVEDTLQSAQTAAHAQWLQPLRWWEHLQAQVVNRQDRRVVIDCGLVLALLHVQLQRPEVGLSARQLSETLGIPRSTAAKKLRVLVTLGLIRRVGRWSTDDAQEYALIYPSPDEDVVKRDTPPVPPNTEGGLSRFTALALGVHRLAIRSHSAFQKIAGGPSLPQSAIDVLLCLEGGSRTRPELVRATGRDRSTIASVLPKLESAGLVVVGPSDVKLIDNDVERALNAWVLAMGIADRRAERRERHQAERAASRRQREMAAIELTVQPGLTRGRQSMTTGRAPLLGPELESPSAD